MRIYKLVIFLSFFSILRAQDMGPEIKETGHIDRLKNGLLIVRLDMKQNKQQAYEDILASSQDEKQRMLIEERLSELKREREEYREHVSRALAENYSFSDYCLIENHQMDQFLNGDASVLDCPDSVDNDARPHYFLIKGQRDSHWIITDDQFRVPGSGFPSSHDLGIKKFFDFLLRDSNHSLENMTKVFSKMNERLEEYYTKNRQ